MLHGVVNIAPKYPDRSGAGDILQYSASMAKAIGFRVLKLELSSVYATKYPGQTWSGTPTSVAQLAAQPGFAAVFSDAWWQQIYLTTFPFASNSINNPWVHNWSEALAEAEEQEVYDLCSYLLSTYSGKTFVLQNWEGDYQLLNSFTPHDPVPRKTINSYADFQRRRMRAINRARAATPSTTTILYDMETSLGLDRYGERVYHSILAKFVAGSVMPDMVGYSAYVAMNGWTLGLTQDQWRQDLLVKFALQSENTRRIVGSAMPLVVSEYGYPIYDPLFIAGGYNVATTYADTIAAAQAAGIQTMIQWELFDNEEQSPGVPRGFLCYDRNGSSTTAGPLSAVGSYFAGIL